MKTIVLIMLTIFSFSGLADVFVKGYHRSNGTYVKPHYRSNNDGKFNNNWSTRGNSNPYTGEKGYKKRKSKKSLSSYPSLNTYDSIGY